MIEGGGGAAPPVDCVSHAWPSENAFDAQEDTPTEPMEAIMVFLQGSPTMEAASAEMMVRGSVFAAEAMIDEESPKGFSTL